MLLNSWLISITGIVMGKILAQGYGESIKHPLCTTRFNQMGTWAGFPVLSELNMHQLTQIPEDFAVKQIFTWVIKLLHKTAMFF